MIMKSLQESLFDDDLINRGIVVPKNKYELKRIIHDYITDLKRYKKIKEMDTIDLNWIDTSLIDDLYDFLGINYQTRERYFRYNLNVSQWDVSNVENMDYAFAGCIYFDCDLSKWCVDNVKESSHMFCGCTNFNSDLSKWDVGKIENTIQMFDKCRKFNSDLSKWDVSNVKDMYRMFAGCTSFNSDLSKWDVSNVKNMQNMFTNCQSLKKIPGWYKEQ